MSGSPEKKEIKPKLIADMTHKDILRIQNHLTQLRFAIIKAQTDVARIIMLEPGETQSALEKEVHLFMREAKAHFKSLADLLIES